ncbi:MAG: integrase core domain-containing protein [candidate division Zixibacteria bacterium]|nr:integrase core domain-containing protein [candidate division Zixibacteria bacterium]
MDKIISLRKQTSYGPERLQFHLKGQYNIRHKFIPSGQCELNGKVERSHRIDEEEFYRLSSYKSLKEIQVTFQKWIFDYNHKRP